MASFYGGVVVGGNSSDSGTNNYNELINLPFKNIIGTISSPINFSNLEFGNYVLQGKYTYDGNEVFSTSSPRIIQVFTDNVTNEKIIKFELFEDYVYYVVNVIYNSEGQYVEEKHSFQPEVDSDDLEAATEEAIAASKKYTDTAMTITIF